MPGNGAAASYGDLLITSLVVLAGVCIAAFVVVKVVGRFLATGRMRGAHLLDVVARLPLEPRRSLYVVEVAGKTLLVGTSEMGLSVLSELDGEEVKARAVPTQSFGELVRSAWMKRRSPASTTSDAVGDRERVSAETSPTRGGAPHARESKGAIGTSDAVAFSGGDQERVSAETSSTRGGVPHSRESKGAIGTSDAVAFSGGDQERVSAETSPTRVDAPHARESKGARIGTSAASEVADASTDASLASPASPASSASFASSASSASSASFASSAKAATSAHVGANDREES